MFFKYKPEQRLTVKSLWQIDEDAHMRNLTGRVNLGSPFTGFNKCVFLGKMYQTTSKKDVRGVAELDMDHRKYTISLEGHFPQLTRSMMTFNITTPIPKFKNMQGKLGFLEKERYLVAMVTYPTGQTGIEVRFQIHSFSSFDVKFILGTPLEFLREVLLVAMLKSDEVKLLTSTRFWY